MQQILANADKSASWLAVSALMLATCGLTFVALSIVPFNTASQTPPDVRLFDPRRPPTRDEGWLGSMMGYALSSPEKNDVVFLGDSACRAAIDPAAFERLTQLRAYNLGIVGDLGPDVRLELAHSYLSTHPLPRLIVLCVSPLGMERDVPVQWRELRDRCLDCYGSEPRQMPAKLGYWIREGTLIKWENTFPTSLRKQPDIRDDVFYGREEKTETYRSYDHSLSKGRGFMPLWGNSYATRLVRKQPVVLVDPVWTEGVRHLAETCRHANLPLLIRLIPIPAEGSESLDVSQIDGWLSEVAQAFPNVTVAENPRLLRYGHELMWDTTHISAKGAVKFTETLAHDVKQLVAHDRLSRK
jgi:hypothetical protein